MHGLTLALAGVAAMVLAPGARADISSSADIADIRLSVTDLTPDDGVAAGFTLDPSLGLSGTSGGLFRDSVLVPAQDSATGWLAPSSASASLPGQAFSATAGPALHVEGHTVAVPFSRYDADAGVSAGLGFFIGPHTQLNMQATYRLQTDFGGYVPVPGDSGYALAQASLFSFVPDDRGGGTPFEDVRNFSFPTRDPYPDHAFEEGILTLTVPNDTDATVFAELQADVVITGFVVGPDVPPPPVPEPATSALAVLGLGILLLLRRRVDDEGRP
jgi:MYXO-CTERM domain-containing protein